MKKTNNTCSPASPFLDSNSLIFPHFGSRAAVCISFWSFILVLIILSKISICCVIALPSVTFFSCSVISDFAGFSSSLRLKMSRSSSPLSNSPTSSEAIDSSSASWRSSYGTLYSDRSVSSSTRNYCKVRFTSHSKPSMSSFSLSSLWSLISSSSISSSEPASTAKSFVRSSSSSSFPFSFGFELRFNSSKSSASSSLNSDSSESASSCWRVTLTPKF